MEEEQQVKTNSRPNLVLVGAIVLGLVILGGGLLVNSQNLSQQSAQTQVNSDSSQSAPEVASTDEGTKVVKVEAGSFYFNPKEIRVKVGDKVGIELTAKDMMHDFNIDELEVDGPVIKAGETTTIEFTAEEVGEFEYYCSVGQHRANGQVGTLIVEE